MMDIDKLADRQERLRKRHEGLLGDQVRDSVAVIGDPEFLKTFSGQVTWGLILNLTARLYKGIRRIRVAVDPGITRLPSVFLPNDLENLRDASLLLLKDLQQGDALEEGIPPDGDDSWIRVHVGARGTHDENAFSVAGAGWVAYLNDDSWQVRTEMNNPVGPMVAACFGAAEVYKRLYSMRRDDGSGRLVFSALDYSNRPDSNSKLPQRLHVPKTYVAGAGAVGMGVLVLLDSIPALQSSDGIFLIDDDVLDATNMNRCVLAILRDVGRRKTEVVRARVGPERLKLEAIDSKWQTFVNRPEHSDPRNFERVVSCVDRYEGRRAVQYDRVPRVLLTAGTGDFLLSVSRHVLADGLSCGLCYQARDAEQGCAIASEGAQQAFEVPPDPSIGFVSVMAGVLLGGELLKEILPSYQGDRVRNTARVKTLFGRATVGERLKDPNCNCSSRYVALGYQKTWKGE